MHLVLKLMIEQRRFDLFTKLWNSLSIIYCKATRALQMLPSLAALKIVNISRPHAHMHYLDVRAQTKQYTYPQLIYNVMAGKF